MDRGDLKEALAQITRVTTRSETAWEANMMEVQLREKLGDTLGTRPALERLLWISPYDVDLHGKMAELATRAGEGELGKLIARLGFFSLDLGPLAVGGRHILRGSARL